MLRCITCQDTVLASVKYINESLTTLVWTVHSLNHPVHQDQICYSNRTKQLTPAPAFHHLEPRQTYQQEKDEATAAIVNTLLVIFVIIIISLIIFISVGYKRKWIEFTCGKKRPKDQEDDVESGEEKQALVHGDYPIKVVEENEEENKRSIDEKSRDAGDENKSQENSTDQTTETEDTDGIEVPFVVNDHDKETRENCDEKRRLVDAKCVVGVQIDANKNKGNQINDKFPLENEREKYEYFWQKHSVFSQWYPCTFVVGDKTYNCAEQYMMHQKAEIMGDEDSAEIIMALNNPKEIKRQGRHVKNFNQDTWESCCEAIVERGNIAKFSQNEELKQNLLLTYPKTLVEASPYDQIWGIGLSEDDPKAWNKLTWRGKNLLGEILTTVRDKLLKNGIENVGSNGNPTDSDL